MVVQIKPERVEITNSARVAVNTEPPQALEAPGGLYPLHARAFEVDEYRMMAGWPVQIPRYDIRMQTMISCDGEVLTGRDAPVSLKTNALIRWTADEEFYDETALRWAPIENKAGNQIVWEGAAENLPVLVDYSYRIKDERFVRKALNFDSDTSNYLEANFESVIGGVAGYTIIMVMSPNSVFDNNVDVPYNGIWCPKSKDADWTEFTIQGNFLWIDTETTERARAISISPALKNTAITYIGIVVDRPNTQFYVGSGPDSIRVQSVPSGKVNPNLLLDLYLGRTTEDLAHTADMALFDLGIYADRLTGGEIRDEFAVLARSYGGDS